MNGDRSIVCNDDRQIERADKGRRIVADFISQLTLILVVVRRCNDCNVKALRVDNGVSRCGKHDFAVAELNILVFRVEDFIEFGDNLRQFRRGDSLVDNPALRHNAVCLFDAIR